MKILLLGATGYLGSNIAAALVDQGHEVSCVVRSLKKAERLNDVHIIMNDDDLIEDEFRRRNYDWVINSVCCYKQNNSFYADMFSANLSFPLKILNMAVKNNIKNFMTIGTSLPDGFNVYSFTKSKLSEIGRYISEHEGAINFAEMKLEMFYGNYAESVIDSSVHDRFIQQMMYKLAHDEDIKLTEGTQKRDIIHVFDVVNIILRVLEMNIHGFRQFPAGTGENHSIREIAEFLRSYMNSSSRIEFGAIPKREGEPDTLADVKWYDEIGYKLKYSFFDGLKYECERIRKDVVHL